MAKGFFITGTDTGIGKTIVAGVVIRAIRILGMSVCAMKPIETGCRRTGGALIPSDGMFLRDISNTDEQINQVTPYTFESPVSPFAASEIEESPIDRDRIRECFDALTLRYDAIVVEGAGGMMVPIKEKYFMSDLALALDLPVIVVAPLKLGAINHTLLTVEHTMRKGLKVAGIILNLAHASDGSLAEKTNPGYLERLSPVPILGVIPHLDDFSAFELDRVASASLDLKGIREALTWR